MHSIYYLGLSGERSLPFGLLVMPPTLKKWGGILVSACPYVCMYVRTYVFMFEISS